MRILDRETGCIPQIGAMADDECSEYLAHASTHEAGYWGEGDPASATSDMDAILRRLSRKRYRSLIDGKDAYEQIRVEPEHVDRTAMTTPDGNMVSLVLQQGDCNAVATYQSLMNYIFGPYIGVFMDVYLDDVVIYSDTLEDHIKHLKLVVDILKREKLYLSATKLHFLCPEMKVLGRIVDDSGIRMDPDKVDNVLNWKVPTNKELLRGFLGSVGYLADDLANVRIPMGILASMTGSESSFKWDFTQQRAFEEIKRLVHAHREHHRRPLDYSPKADPIWLVTDGSHGGIAGVVTQGKTWQQGQVAAFFSAKLSSAQSNYPVHEVEMLAGVEAMLRHRDILLGCAFTWVTDHKGLIHLLNQRNLSGRQARWMEKISEFNFKIEYVPGVDNVLADALSRIYSNDQPGTVRAASEYSTADETARPLNALTSQMMSVPVLVDTEGRCSSASLELELSAITRRQSTAQTTAQTALTTEPNNTSITPKRARRRAVEPPLPPESGRPETSKEFAKRIRRVVLRVPETERQEGGEQTKTQPKRDDTGNQTEPGKNDNSESPASTTLEQTRKTASEQLQAVTGTTERSDLSKRLLVDHIAATDDGIHLESAIRGRCNEDTFFASILRQPKQYKNFEVVDGLVFLRDRGRTLLCIPNILVRGRNAREIVITHAHSLLAHLGAAKTTSLLRDHVWWKTMAADVARYCETCMTCKRSKPDNQKPYGLLNPLPVPTSPWEAIGIDFVGPLPESQNRDGSFDAITTVIDLLTGMVHLVPSRTNYRAKDVAELIFAEVYKHHGLPKSIVSDRDVLFTSTFWTHLHKLIGVELRMSSAYHPESDGSTERANRTISQMLRQCVGPSQRDWVARLPAIEFAINLARSEATGYAPFFLNTGRMPRPMIWDHAKADEYPGVRVYAQKVKAAVMAAHDSIIAARVKQTRDANRRRRPAPFTEGDLVYISTKNISLPKGLARKLAPKYIGPYRILRDFKNGSFRIDLPGSLKRRGVHDVFHASLLRVHEPNDDRLFPGRLDSQIFDLEDSENEWAIDRIIAHRGAGQAAVFEVLWKSGDRTWVQYGTIAHLVALQSYLEAQGLSILSNGDVILSSPSNSEAHLFTPAQVRVILEFDAELRRTRKLDRAATPIPGGYDDFQWYWNLDDNNQYQVAQYDPEVTVPHDGQAIPMKLLLPAVTMAPVTANPAALGSSLENDEAGLFRRMLLSAAERDQRQQETARAKYHERVQLRGRKATDRLRTAAMKAKANMAVASEAGRASKRFRTASPTPTDASHPTDDTRYAPWEDSLPEEEIADAAAGSAGPGTPAVEPDVDMSTAPTQAAA
ncbi:LOW QUALITY PROTEIN: hypothetical protein ACG7TL_005758 [Trametes sanguinea]